MRGFNVLRGKPILPHLMNVYDRWNHIKARYALPIWFRGKPPDFYLTPSINTLFLSKFHYWHFEDFFFFKQVDFFITKKKIKEIKNKFF